MGRLANTPSWGVLVQAPIEQVREILAPFKEHLELRTNAGWTAGFYMDIVDTADDEAAERLRTHGYVPVYRFDFSKYQFSTSRWDGQCWNPLAEDGSFVDPDDILGEVGIRPPYWDTPEPKIKIEPLETREALVVEGASVEQVRAIIGERWRIEPGPRGAIVYEPEGAYRDVRLGVAFDNARFALWDHAPQRVLEIKFYPKSGNFWFAIMKGEECLGTFRPGQTRTWDGTPFLASVEGETEPVAIVEKLGIPRSFLARS